MRIFSKLTLGVLALSLAAAPSFAKHHGTRAAKEMNCPVCHMKLTSEKTDTMDKAVKMGRKTYYCCSQCNMSSMSKSKGHHHGKHHGEKMEEGGEKK